MMLLIIAVACLAGAVFLAGEVAAAVARACALDAPGDDMQPSESPRRSTSNGYARRRSSPCARPSPSGC